MAPADERAAMCEVYENAVAWVLRNIRTLNPFPVTRQLGIFDVDVPEAMLAPKPERAPLALFEEHLHGSKTRHTL